MPRKDSYHNAVKIGLQKKGWLITDDPFTITSTGMDVQIDLAAVESISAQLGAERMIAVEIKSLKQPVRLYDFYQALGQYMVYQIALEKYRIEKTLYLAIPISAYNKLKEVDLFREAWRKHKVNLLIFNEKTKNILKWINH